MFHRALRQPLVVAAVLLLAAQLGEGGLIIDDFTDPAEIRLPEGPASVITEQIGDLNATRYLRFRLIEPAGQIANANVGITDPGEYVVDVDNASRVLFVDAQYAFPATDLTQGGMNDAFFVEFTFAEGIVTTLPATGEQIQPPAVRLVAYTTDRRPGILVAEFSNAVTAPFPHHQAPYTLVAPFEMFTDPDGGAVGRHFSGIQGFELWLSAAGGYGPWEVRIDSIRVGYRSAVPEPSGLVLVLSFFACVSAVTVWHRFFSKVGSSERRNHDDIQEGNGLGDGRPMPVRNRRS